jgi:hypothetical protein
LPEKGQFEKVSYFCQIVNSPKAPVFWQNKLTRGPQSACAAFKRRPAACMRQVLQPARRKWGHDVKVLPPRRSVERHHFPYHFPYVKKREQKMN